MNAKGFYDLGYERAKRFMMDTGMISVREGIAEMLLQYPRPDRETKRLEFEKGVMDFMTNKRRLA